MSTERPALTDRSSRWLAHGIGLLAVALPLAVIVWGWQSTPQEWAQRAGATAPLAGGLRLAIGLLALLPVLCVSAGLVFARRCFLAFARGEHFSLATVRALRACALAMVAAGAAGLAVPPLAGLLASGGHRLAIELGSGQLLLLLFGALVWKVASGFERGIALADENAQFV